MKITRSSDITNRIALCQCGLKTHLAAAELARYPNGQEIARLFQPALKSMATIARIAVKDGFLEATKGRAASYVLLGGPPQNN